MAQPAARRRRPPRDDGPSFFDAIAPAPVTPPPTQPKPDAAPAKDAPPPPVVPTPTNAAPASDWSVVAAMIDAARAAGSHGSTVRDVCQRCREWCDGHYHNAAVGGGGGTAGSMMICKGCYEATKTAADESADKAAADSVRKPKVIGWVDATLEDVLILWANEHAPALAAAWCRAAPRDEPGKLAAIFRDRAIRERQTFPAWACLHWGRAVLELLPMAFPENAAQRWFEAELALGGTAVHDPDARPAVAFVRKVAA